MKLRIFWDVLPVPPSTLSHSHTLTLSLLLWTAHPPAIGPVPSLSSVISYWSAQSTGLYITSDPSVLGSPGIENTRGLNLAAVKPTTVQVTKLQS
jgi:hypothetical protein